MVEALSLNERGLDGKAFDELNGKFKLINGNFIN
jgi:hypothetical protein